MTLFRRRSQLTSSWRSALRARLDARHRSLAEFRACAVNLHRAFGLYGKPETAAAGQRAVQGTFAKLSRHLTSYEPEALQEAYTAYMDVGIAIERFRLDPPEQCKAHIETFVGRLLFDERTLFTRLETLRLVRTFRTPLVLQVASNRATAKRFRAAATAGPRPMPWKALRSLQRPPRSHGVRASE